MLTGEPLFPGDSDIDQLYHITRCFGNLILRHREIFQRNPLFVGMRLPDIKEVEPLEKRFHKISHAAMDMLKVSLDCGFTANLHNSWSLLESFSTGTLTK